MAWTWLPCCPICLLLVRPLDLCACLQPRAEGLIYCIVVIYMCFEKNGGNNFVLIYLEMATFHSEYKVRGIHS